MLYPSLFSNNHRRGELPVLVLPLNRSLEINYDKADLVIPQSRKL